MTPDALAALHQRCFTAPPPWSAASFAALLQDRHVFLRADPQGRAFAMGRVILDEAELLTLATAPETRRTGLGQAMLTHFEAQARARDATSAFLEVAETNHAARALYQRAGWAETGRRPGYYVAESGAPVSALILCKTLAPALR